MLLLLMLIATLLVIALAAVAPKLSQQVRRDQEEELIHRGVQYSRAIRKYYKKFGRYPGRVEELENTNNLRFLRRRYKDPITGNDFKLLHFGEVQMFAGVPPGASPVPGVQTPQTPTAPGQTQSANPDQSNSTSTQDQNSSSSSSPSSSSSSSPSSLSSSPSSSSSSFSSSSSPSPLSSSSSRAPGAGSSPGPGGPLSFGGSPLVGVVSTSKKQSIREFNKKNHYDQWQFVYDPTSDRGGLLNTPAQPALQGTGSQNQPGQNANPPGVPSLGGPLPQGGTPQPPPQPQTPPAQPPQ